jgi:hypothetical protein
MASAGRFIAFLTAALIALAGSACGTDTPSPPTPAPTDTPVLTPTATPTQGPSAVCLAGQGFVPEGEVASFPGDGAAARKIGALRWAAHPGCERFAIDLARADGSPAMMIDGVRVEFLRHLGIVRVELPGGVQEADEKDMAADGPLFREAFVVRREDRGLNVDIHLARPALARVLLLSNPARVVVDLSPGGAEYPRTALRDTRVVVLEAPSDTSSYPIEVVGYARTFEANVIARLRQGGQIRAEEFTTATDWVDAWGMFRLTIARGPTGRVELFVGELSARDGTEEGLRIDLTMR